MNIGQELSEKNKGCLKRIINPFQTIEIQKASSNTYNYECPLETGSQMRTPVEPNI